MLILAILKWIGVVILILLAVVLILLAYFLFFPVSYKLNGDFTNLKAIFSVSDLLKFFNFSITLNKIDLDIGLRLLFGLIKPDLDSKNKSKENSKSEKTESSKEAKDSIDNTSNNNDKTPNKPKKSLKEIISILRDDKNEDALNYVLLNILKLVKKLKPKSFKANIDFAGESPDQTGYITAILSIIPFVNVKGASIRPDFLSETPYVSGKFRIRGGIRLISIVITLFTLFKHKGVRRILQKLR